MFRFVKFLAAIVIVFATTFSFADGHRTRFLESGSSSSSSMEAPKGSGSNSASTVDAGHRALHSKASSVPKSTKSPSAASRLDSKSTGSPLQSKSSTRIPSASKGERGFLDTKSGTIVVSKVPKGMKGLNGMKGLKGVKGRKGMKGRKGTRAP